MQDPVCSSSKDLQCTSKVNVKTSTCLKPCTGLIVNSFSKLDVTQGKENLMPILGMEITIIIRKLQNILLEKLVNNPHLSSSGLCKLSRCIWYTYLYILDYEWKNTLRYVSIYFDTPTFDRIEKDRAAKFVDMLSAIGGTMGLLTGFSIISAVEILYFAAKIIFKILKKEIA